MPLPRPIARHRLAAGLVAGALVGSLLTVAGSAVARIPDSRTGVITACRTAAGTIRLIDAQARQRCRRGESAVRWNATGPRGPQGVPGPVGPTGATGPAGPTLPVVRRTANLALTSPGTTSAVMNAEVPKGSYVETMRVYVTSAGYNGNAPTTYCNLADLEGRLVTTSIVSVGLMPQQVLAHSAPGGTQKLLTCSIALGNGSTNASTSMVVEALFAPTPGFA